MGVLRLSCLFLLCAVLSQAVLCGQGIVINEILTSNGQGIADEDGDRPDWIELYHSGAEPLSLSGYFLSDDPADVFMWELPDTVMQPESFLLIFASGKDRRDSALHTNFRISRSGEPLLLSTESQAIDALGPVYMLTDQSYGSLTDGAVQEVCFSTPTPGASNAAGIVTGPPDVEVSFSHSTGFYTDTVYITMEGPPGTTEIRYTADGSVPGANSTLYTGPIAVYDRTSEDPGIAGIPTNPPDGPAEYLWQASEEEVFRGSVIRAAAYEGELPVTAVTARTCFFAAEGRERIKLPVISLVTDSINLFDYSSGIYVPGLYHDLNPTTWYWGSGNYHQRGIAWERPVHFTYIDTLNEVKTEINAGLRIHGGGSRALPQKSLRICARSDYGEETLNQRFFSQSEDSVFRQILLRTSGQDYNETMFRDALCHSLISHLDMEFQHAEPTVVFINGVYWGIQNIRERLDKHYIARRTGADPDNLDLISLENSVEVSEGDHAHFAHFLDMLENADMNSDAAIALVMQTIDLENYLDYIIAKMYIAVYDWPGNNVRYWRERVPGGKYRWIMFDNDGALKDTQLNAFEHATATGHDNWPNPEWSTFLLRKIFESDSLRARFTDRAAYHLTHTFSTDRLLAAVDSFDLLYAPHTPEHIARWGYPYSMNTRNDYVEGMRTFAVERPCVFRNHLINFFGIEADSFLPELCDPTIGSARGLKPAGGLDIFPNPNNGDFRIKLRRKGSHAEHIRITVYDLSGRKAAEQTFRSESSETTRDLRLRLPKGVYMVCATGEGFTNCQKTVVAE